MKPQPPARARAQKPRVPAGPGSAPCLTSARCALLLAASSHALRLLPAPNLSSSTEADRPVRYSLLYPPSPFPVKSAVPNGCAARCRVAVGYRVQLARGSTQSSAQQAARHPAAAPSKETKGRKERKVRKNAHQGVRIARICGSGWSGRAQPPDSSPICKHRPRTRAAGASSQSLSSPAVPYRTGA
jgi:hypothetical protein